MADQNETQNENTSEASGKTVKLNGLFVFKLGMTSVYGEDGEAIPVTILKYEPWFISQVKTKETDGYEALQLACKPRKASRSNQSETTRLKSAGFENGAKFVREMRQNIPEGTMVGQRVDLSSIAKGDQVRLSGVSKGRGFMGVVRRWGFAGGPASHGSGFHRKPGSVGNRTWPGRVIPGKRMAGRWGNDLTTVKNAQVVDVLADENIVLVKGPVPGSRNSLVQLIKA